LDGKVSALDEKVGSLDEKIDRVDANLSGQIRHQGVLLEDMRDDICALRDGHNFLTGLKEDVQQILRNTADLPLIRKTVADHSRLLAAR
ncbi:hypothetical protein JXA05_03510, partial [Candidatus Peregrinibacteria bacterium]|nr:hypothetical protein [Candidatus Peregrinibacteria bacterium]